MAKLRHNKTEDDYEIITTAEGTQRIAAKMASIANIPANQASTTSHTSSTSIDTTDGLYHDNTGAGGLVTLTLPDPSTVSPNVEFSFEITAAQTFDIKAAAGDFIQIGTIVSIDGGSVQSAIVGSIITLQPSGSATWVVSELVGPWDLEDT